MSEEILSLEADFQTALKTYVELDSLLTAAADTDALVYSEVLKALTQFLTLAFLSEPHLDTVLRVHDLEKQITCNEAPAAKEEFKSALCKALCAVRNAEKAF